MPAVRTFIRWNGSLPTQAAEILAAPGGLVFCATKVGYILMATGGPGLERKLDEVRAFYQMHCDTDILLGCILPWRPEALPLIPDATTRALATDGRGTSCFVIKFGRPAEQLAERMWQSRIRHLRQLGQPLWGRQ